MPDINPRVGRWSDGSLIDISGIPLEYAERWLVFSTERACEFAHGGVCRAVYRYAGNRESSGMTVYHLVEVSEVVPPRTPALSLHRGNDARLPMPSVAEEIEQRRKEWAVA